MNWIIITIGMALVIALSAAAVGPYFVDWTAYRATLETQAERLLGTDVTIAGSANMRLLPAPHVRVDDVLIGDPARPLLTAPRIVIDVALTPLLSRRIRVTEMTMNAPELTLRIDENGVVEAPAQVNAGGIPFLADAAFALDNVSVTNGTVRIDDARTGRQSALYGLNLTGQARSLSGPFSIRGSGELAGRTADIRVTGGAVDADGALALSVRIDPAGEAFRFAADGALEPSLTAPRFAGEATLDVATRDGTPLSVSGALTVTPERITLARAPLRYGEGDGELEVAVTAVHRPVSNDPLFISLDTRQLDLDRLVNARTNPEALAPAAAAPPPPPRDALPVLSEALAPLSTLLAAGDGPDMLVELNAGTIVLGGSVLRDFSAAVRAGGNTELERAEALLPGDTLVELSGTLGGGFDGRLTATSTEPAALARWWTGSAITSAPGEPVRLDARVALTGGGALSAPRIALRVGQSSVTGRLAVEPAGASGRRNVEIGLRAPFLNAADLRGLGGVLMSGQGISLAGTNLILDVAVERMRIGTVEGDALNINAQYSDGTLVIDALVADDLAGTELVASGDISGLAGAPVGTISGSLALRDTARLSEALRSLAPASAPTQRAAEIVSRTDTGALSFALSGGGAGEATLNARLSGNLGSTTIDVEASGRPAPDNGSRDLALGLTVENDAMSALLAQLGVPGVAAEDARFPGPARMTLDLDGPEVSQLLTDLSIEALGTSLDYEGGVALSGGTVALNGALSINTQTLAPLAALTGRPVPMDGPVTLDAELSTGPDGALAVSGLSGNIDGVGLRGELSLAGSTLTGALDLEEARAATLLALILGRDAFVADPDAPGDAWPTTAFTPPPLPPVTFDLALVIDRLLIGPHEAPGATGVLALSPTSLALTEIDAPFAGGTLQGDLRIGRDGPRADLIAALTLDGATLDEVVWQAGDQPVAKGTVGVALDVASSGFTVADLVAGLVGAGTMSLADIEITRLNPAPFPAPVLSGEDAAPPSDAALLAALDAHIGAGALTLPALNTPFQVNAGTVRIDPVALAPGLLASATLDLAARQTDGTISLPVASERDDRPDIAISFSGPLAAPSRTIDPSALSAWLNLVALEEQVRAVEEQNEELAEEAEAIE